MDNNQSYLTRVQALFGSFFIVAVSAISGAILALLFLPLAFNSNPLDFYNRTVFQKEKSSSQTIIKTSKTSDPVVAVAEKVKPAVVNIKIKKVSADFFGSQSVSEGVGSGVIFKKNGYIITNSHVVEGASDITVTLGNDKDVKGKVVGADSDADIAVVKIDQDNLPTAVFSKGRDLRVGQLVVAIGSPLSFEHTVTSGIISALNRPLEMSPEEDGSNKTFTDLIQTDAAINPGNSGGALANERGEIIGINTLIASQSGGNQGIGFAIPANSALEAANQLITTGKVTHPYIGVTGQTLDKEVAQEGKLPVEQGALIGGIIPGSPAAKAGLKAGDIIVSIKRDPVHSMEDLITLIRRNKVGDTVDVEFYRGSNKQSIRVKIAQRPKQ